MDSEKAAKSAQSFWLSRSAFCKSWTVDWNQVSVLSGGATVGNVVQEVSSAFEGETNQTVLRGRSRALDLGGGVTVKPLF